MKTHRITLLFLLIIVIPIILWFIAPYTTPRFSSLSNLSVSLGQLLGLIGVILLSLSFILSTRLKFIDKFFYGLNNVYLKHSQIGQIGLILLLFHPLLLLPKYTTNLHEVALFLFLSKNWAYNWGILSLYGMIGLIILTLYLRPKYNIWKFTHKFLGITFLFAALHVWMTPSDVSRFLPLKIYILTIIFLGIISFFYKTVFGKFLIKKYKYKVTSIEALSDIVTEIVLSPVSKKMQYKSGQFIFINFLKQKIGNESHPFSLTSSPDDNDISISVKNLGDYTSEIRNIEIGAIAEIEGPFGDFSQHNSIIKNQIWIAGGIGITPFISMAKSIKKEMDYKIDLYYCVKNISEAVHLARLENISISLDNTINIISFCSQDKGYLSVKAIKETSGNIMNKSIFLCAPPKMIKSLKDQFILDGVTPENIYSEEFTY